MSCPYVDTNWTEQPRHNQNTPAHNVQERVGYLLRTYVPVFSVSDTDTVSINVTSLQVCIQCAIVTITLYYYYDSCLDTYCYSFALVASCHILMVRFYISHLSWTRGPSFSRLVFNQVFTCFRSECALL